MFRKTMTFDDLEGNEVTQTFYFNYNKLEIAKLLEFHDLEAKVERLTTTADDKGLDQTQNTMEAYEIFEELIAGAYGVKVDGVEFDKSPELTRRWKNHSAFPELIFEMLGDTDLAAEFMEKALPPRLIQQAKAELDKNPTDAEVRQMVATAAERQANPETAMAPGTYPGGLEVGGEIKTSSSMPVERRARDLTEAELLSMPEEEFRKLNVRELTPEQVQVAFRRKMQS